MSLDTINAFLKEKNLFDRVLVFEESIATVQLAAEVIGVEPARIAKTLSLRYNEDHCVVLVMAGNRGIDNKKFRDTFKLKARMLNSDEVLEKIGMPVGGVCPFGIPSGVPIYLDKSLQLYPSVYPACGTIHSALELNAEELEKCTGGSWVDVTKDIN